MKSKSRLTVSPRLALFLGVLFLSWSAIFIKLSVAPVLSIAFYRMFLSTLLLTPGVIVRGLPRIRPRQLLLMMISGLLLAAHFVAWIGSLKLTNVAIAAILVNTHPLLVAGLAWLFLGERIGSRSVLWIVLSIAAMAALSLSDFGEGGSGATGNLLAVLGALLVSGYFIIGRLVRRTFPVRVYVYLVYATSAGVLLIACLLLNAPLIGLRPLDYLLFLGLAVFPTLLGHSVFNWALGHLKTSVVATAVLGEPLFATILGLIILGEVPDVMTLVAGPILLWAIYRFVKIESNTSAPRANLDSPGD